jgi:hypothetical protein
MMISLPADNASLLTTTAGLQVLKAVDGFTDEVAAVIPWTVFDDLNATRQATEGWPPDGIAPMVLGFDYVGNPVLLRWDPVELRWQGLRWQTVDVHRPMPQAFTRSPSTEPYVDSWMRLPVP